MRSIFTAPSGRRTRLRGILTITLFLASALALNAGCAAKESEATNVGEDHITVPAPDNVSILETVATTVKPDLANQDVVLNPDQGSLRISDGFSWVIGRVELKAGGAPTTKRTIFEEAEREGLFDGFQLQALLKKDGDHWIVVEHAIGATEAWFEGIEQRVPGVPRAIFPHLDPH